MRMSKVKIIAAIVFSFFSLLTNARTPCVGTFSNLAFNSDAGDVLGTEIRVVMTSSGYKATV